jgi:hypothetical protein
MASLGFLYVVSVALIDPKEPARFEFVEVTFGNLRFY